MKAGLCTRIFALNSGNVDANAINIVKPDATYGAQYDFANVGLTKPPRSTAKASATLVYLDKVVAV